MKKTKKTQEEQQTVQEIIYEIQALHKQRLYCITQTNRIMSACGASIRTALGYISTMSEKERKEYCDRAYAIIEFIINGKDLDTGDDAVAEQMRNLVVASSAGAQPMIDLRKVYEKRMKQLAVMLPVWEEVGSICGLGELCMAMLVGEAGDFSNYSNPAKLWKRFGVAVMDDGNGNLVRQGQVSKECSREERATVYTEHGYSPRRRSILWQVADTLLRQKNEFKRDYDRVKAHELTKTIDGKPITPGHAHNRAKRHASKELLKAIWCAWTGAQVVAA